ncbi:MAG TPA: ABC transporter ATP-binding protein, partial [Afifellaceae bacterium]|nr:ABC transporter ATP-binding protein [Afifellaceae bacterium]
MTAADPNEPGRAAQATVLSLAGITKSFGALRANDGIDLNVGRGEILALLGENGAGKTTLMNILFGHYVADEGTVSVAGPDGRLQPLEPGSPQAALDAGIGMVHQHFTLAENLSAFDNIVLGTEPVFSLRRRAAGPRRQLEELMQQSGLGVDLDRRVDSLSVGEKQRVEILKALYRRARILVLDEPTAVLTPPEADSLFETLKRLAADGLSVIFISHKLHEVLAVSDRIAVLRGGRKAGEMPTAGADRRSIAELMVGRDVPAPARAARMLGEPVLELDSVSVHGSDRSRTLLGVSLTVHAGEIVGIAGVSGNGQAALAGLAAGLMTPAEGSMRLAGHAVANHAPAAFARAGVARIPEDRHHDGVVGSMTIAENLIVERLEDPAIQRAGFLDFAGIRRNAEQAIEAYDVRCPGPQAQARLLSGGNIQKLILARVLDRDPKLVLANQPTRGLD